MNRLLWSFPARGTGYPDFNFAAGMSASKGRNALTPQVACLFGTKGIKRIKRYALYQRAVAKKPCSPRLSAFCSLPVNSTISSAKGYSAAEQRAGNASFQFLATEKEGKRNPEMNVAKFLSLSSVRGSAGLYPCTRQNVARSAKEIKNAPGISKVLMIGTAYFTFYYVSLSESECCMVMPLGHFQPEEHSCASH